HLSSEQQKSVNIINRGNDQYFRVVTRLTRAAAYRQNGAIADANRELASAGVALKNTQEALQKFKLQSHEEMDTALTEKTIQSWSTLLGKGIEPMFKAVSANRFEDYNRMFNNEYPQLSREFGATIEKYNSAVDKSTEAASLRVESLVTWCERA
ncbi:Tar ligand binding domain-containing protein, partial [Enterobacter bugandensis]